jgi:hypothetical protein
MKIRLSPRRMRVMLIVMILGLMGTIALEFISLRNSIDTARLQPLDRAEDFAFLGTMDWAPKRLAAQDISFAALFSPPQAPAISKPVETVTPPSERDLRLVAVTLADDQRLAIFSEPGQKDLIRLAVGEELGGWRLVELSGNRAILERAGKSWFLLLADEKPSSASISDLTLQN